MWWYLEMNGLGKDPQALVKLEDEGMLGRKAGCLGSTGMPAELAGQVVEHLHHPTWPSSELT